MRVTTTFAQPSGPSDPTTLSRRVFVIRAAQTLGVAQLSASLGCAVDGSSDGGGGGGSVDGGPSSSGAGVCCEAGGDFGGSAGTTVGPQTGGLDTRGDTSSTGLGGSSSGTTDDGPAQCSPSPSDIEGPFYRPGIPVGANLDVHGDTGVALTLAGRVVDLGCKPVSGAVVELWHATPVAPAAKPGDVNATYDNSDQYRYYGQIATAPDGSFEFVTLRPGWYLNGAQYRPAHLHLKVWVDGTERLTTQLYFMGDQFNDSDAWFNPVMALDPNAAGLAEIEIVL